MYGDVERARKCVLSLMTQLDEIHSRFTEQVNAAKDLAVSVVGPLLPKVQEVARIVWSDDPTSLDPKLRISRDEFYERTKKDPEGVLIEFPRFYEVEKMPKEQVNAIREISKIALRVRLINEMALVHIVAFQEAFIADYLKAICRLKPSILSSEKKLDLTFEEACDFQSLDEFREYLANADIESILHGGIDDVAEYFDKRLGVDLEKCKHWEKVREASFRRNIIIHNKGEVNETYRRKTNYTGPDGHLSSYPDYLADVAMAIVSLMDFVHEQLSDRIV
jgi:hypothetical protein